MSEKKTGKRLLSWVLVLIMALSMLPLNVLADEVGGDSVIYGHYKGNNWISGPDANAPSLPVGVDSVNKTAEPTGNRNEYTVTLQVQMHTTTTTQTSYAQAATVLVIDTSGSMSYCLQPEHEHNDSCYNVTETKCSHNDHKNPKDGKIYTHEDGTRCICSKSGRKSNYYVLDWTCSLTEHTHSVGCGNGNDRLAAAKVSAIEFLNSYRAGGTGRYVALVAFNKSAAVADARWQDVSTEAGYNAIWTAIDGLEAGGGTNLDAGLQKANPLFADPQVQGIDSKNIIALTDGKPTYYMTDIWGYPVVGGDGEHCSKDVFEATANTAESIRTSGTTLYSICFGAANEKVKNPDTDAYISLLDYLNTYIDPGKTYSAADFTGLKDAFDAISSSITSGLSSGTVHDSLPDGVTSDAIPNRTVKWDLNTFDKETSTNGPEGNTTTYYTYTKSYTVTIDPTQIQVNDGDYYPLNGPTTLTVKGSNNENITIDFPIPAGKVTLPKYKLTYIVDGETYDENTYEFGATLPAAPTPTKEGYNFSGWDKTTPSTMPAENLVISGSFNKNSYKLTYIVDGETYDENTYEFGATLPAAPTPAKEGYTFSGWDAETPATMPANDLVINGNFTINKYTVTYKVDGEVYGTPTSYEFGATLPTAPTPTKEGYTFSGWDAETPATMPAKDLVINGNFTINKYTVTYNSNGGSTVDPQTVKYNDKAKEPTAPTKSGYTFAGWYTDNEKFTTKYDFATPVTADITLYAQWTRNYTPRPYTPPTVVIPDDDALGLNTTDHFAYIVGYGNGEVRPQNNITRAEVATIFFRLLTDDVRDENLTKTNRYSDVASTAWYNTAVSTLSSMGIITGYPDGTFRPNAAITRAEFAAIAARFDHDGDKTAAKFSDIANHWAKDEISIAYNNGWITGYPDGTFGPQRDITRAETMTLVNRVLNRQPETEDDLLPNMTVWTDNANPKAWYYLAVQEATNSHYYKFKTNSKYEKWTELRETRDWTQLEK